MKENITASEISSHEYCELSWYYDETDKEPSKDLKKEKESSLQSGTEEHEKVGRKIKHEKKKVSVGTWLILLSFCFLIIFIIWHLYF